MPEYDADLELTEDMHHDADFIAHIGWKAVEEGAGYLDVKMKGRGAYRYGAERGAAHDIDVDAVDSIKDGSVRASIKSRLTDGQLSDGVDHWSENITQSGRRDVLLVPRHEFDRLQECAETPTEDAATDFDPKTEERTEYSFGGHYNYIKRNYLCTGSF
jgi:hypothetical protein